MSIADTSQGTKDVTQEYRDKGILPPVDPEAPTPKTRLPWLVKAATFDQLSLTLALMEEQGYTPTIVCPGGMIPDSRPGGGSMWSAVGYTVCGRLKEEPSRTEADRAEFVRICQERINAGTLELIDPAKPITYENLRRVESLQFPLKGQLREATAAHVMTPPVAAPSLPVQPRGKGKKCA